MWLDLNSQLFLMDEFRQEVITPNQKITATSNAAKTVRSVPAGFKRERKAGRSGAGRGLSQEQMLKIKGGRGPIVEVGTGKNH